ncbi:MAG: peptidase M15, partial [bacterium]|nr:peptidase M15 [bacterium]
IFGYLKEHTDFDQLIWEFGNEMNPAWVHCSYTTGRNRGEVLVAYKDGGKTRYKRL